MVSIEKIKKLREETGLSIGECEKALKEGGGDLDKAREILSKKGEIFAQKRIERETGYGVVASYIHYDKKVGTMIELRCESDFVARSEDFQKLAHEICLQIAAISPEEIPILEQKWIKDENKTMKELIDDYISKFGENIVLKRFVRYQI